MDSPCVPSASGFGHLDLSSLSSACAAGQISTGKEENSIANKVPKIDSISGIRIKPKQSKSRNGCVTCKGKRLKCDETKPTCQQCRKRGVECGGYKKDFKWRAYEEPTLPKTPKSFRKGGNGITKNKKTPPPLLNGSLNSDASYLMQETTLSPFSPPFDSPSAYGTSPQYGYPSEVPLSVRSQYFDPEHGFMTPQDGSFSLSPSPLQLEHPHHSHTSQPSIEAFVDGTNVYPSLDHIDAIREEDTRPNSLTTVILPLISVEPTSFSVGDRAIKEEDLEAETSEALHAHPQFESWPTSYPSPPLSDYSSSSSDSYSTTQTLARPLDHIIGSPEALLSHFDNYTCGIMSIKNGPNENPWRTLIWPLAQHTPALYHALAAMTAFHMSRKSPAYRVEGVEHIRHSLGALRDGIGSGTMSDEGALATTLVLAFSDAFDRHISTGSQHLKGAKILINQALAKHERNPQWGDGLKRLEFLHNVWVYLEVLARLTSDGDDDEIPTSMLFGPLSPSKEIDPLMGCAVTLFPLIGRVATLARKVRQSPTNSLELISEAMELKSLLEGWVPGADFQPPEDQTMEIVHCLKTAEAYQYATLLYLHQAVPEIPSATSCQLAKKVLGLLAAVPITSGACIVHMYPLLVAGCEVRNSGQRRWVQDRWEQMSARMWIGNVDKAWQVVKEVWDRRDAYARQKEIDRSRMLASQYSSSHPSSRATSLPPGASPEDALSLSYGDVQEPVLLFDKWGVPIDLRVKAQRPNIVRSSSEGLVEEFAGDMDQEASVKSNLHWVSVMKDWQWEVLLG